NIDLCEAAPEPVLARAEQDARAVNELDSLSASARKDTLHKRLNLGKLRHGAHRLKRLVMRPRPMRRPQHQRVRVSEAQSKSERPKGVRLPRLSRDGNHRAADATRIQSTLALPHNCRQKASLPRVKRDTHANQLPRHRRPRRASNPIKKHQMARNIR